MTRNYRCPECGGEFDSFDLDQTTQKCPFCGLAKYSWEKPKSSLKPKVMKSD